MYQLSCEPECEHIQKGDGFELLEQVAKFRLTKCDQKPFKHGWHLFSGQVERSGQDLYASILLVTEDQSTYQQFVPITLKGSFNEVVLLPKKVKSLFFIPMKSTGFVAIESLAIKSIPFYEKNYRMAKRLYHAWRTLPEDRLHKVGFRWHLPFWNLQKAYQQVSSFRGYGVDISYKDWIYRFDRLEPRDETKIRRKIKRFPSSFALKVLILGVSSRSSHFQKVESVLRKDQYFQAFDCVAELDGIDCIQESDYVVVINKDISLRPHALYWLAHQFINNPQTPFIYSDHDYRNESGQRCCPHFKPEWSPELLYSYNYIGGLIAFNNKALLLKNLCSENAVQCGLSIYQIALAFTYKTFPIKNSSDKVCRIPAVLYHNVSPTQKVIEKENRALLEHFKHHHVKADVTIFHSRTQSNQNQITANARNVYHRIDYGLVSKPLISIIIPTKDALGHLKVCVDSVLNKTHYLKYEILIIDNQSVKKQTFDYFESLDAFGNVRVLKYDKPFNYSAINNYAVSKARGEMICLLNNDTEVIDGDWLGMMLGNLQQPQVGIVGCKLLYDNNTVQHVGDAVGPGGCADHFMSGIEEDDPGYFGRAVVAQDLSAVTAACLLTYKDIFNLVEGLNEQNLAVAFNDVDYCLKVRQAGYRVVMNPHVKLYHHESVSRGNDNECPIKSARAKGEANYMRLTWENELKDDPFYNPNLNYARPDFSLSHSPLVTHPWLVR